MDVEIDRDFGEVVDRVAALADEVEDDGRLRTRADREVRAAVLIGLGSVVLLELGSAAFDGRG